MHTHMKSHTKSHSRRGSGAVVAGVVAALVLSLALALGAAPPALATTGFDREARVLGYDAGDRKIFFLLDGEDGETPEVYYFDLDSATPRVPQRVRSWLEAARAQSELDTAEYVAQRLRRLEERLVPLEAAAEAIGLTATLRPDGQIPSPTAPEFDLPRYALELELSLGELGGALEATAFCRPTLELRAVVAVPAVEAAVAVVRYVGDPYEVCYTVERVVLLVPAREGVQ